jgi:hypothetical protein
LDSVSDPDLIGSVDLDPVKESGSRKAKITHKKDRKFYVASPGCSL